MVTMKPDEPAAHGAGPAAAGPQPATPPATASANGHQPTPNGRVTRLDDPALMAIPPAARPLQGKPAGVVSRVVANTIDFLVMGLIFGGGYLGVAAVLFLWSPSSFKFPHMSRFAIFLACGLILWWYLAICWVLFARTIGDNILGLNVVRMNGKRVGPVVAALRATACVFFPIGLLWCAVNPRNASVQDILVRTSVVYAWQGSALRRRR